MVAHGIAEHFALIRLLLMLEVLLLLIGNLRSSPVPILQKGALHALSREMYSSLGRHLPLAHCVLQVRWQLISEILFSQIPVGLHDLAERGELAARQVSHRIEPEQEVFAADVVVTQIGRDALSHLRLRLDRAEPLNLETQLAPLVRQPADAPLCAQRILCHLLCRDLIRQRAVIVYVRGSLIRLCGGCWRSTLTVYVSVMPFLQFGDRRLHSIEERLTGFAGILRLRRRVFCM
jgi:hypothetical protein